MTSDYSSDIVTLDPDCLQVTHFPALALGGGLATLVCTKFERRLLF